MSEYQYYDFLAIDQPLGERDMDELRSISSRARITRTRFSNEYSFGDLKADPRKLVEQYFDLHVYVANWGSRRLILRLPHATAPIAELKWYCAGQSTSVRRAGAHLIVDLWREESDDSDDPDDWVAAERWADSMVEVRRLLLEGDRRPLYFGWLLGLQSGEFDDDRLEPPVPPGLAGKNAGLASLAEFLHIDEDLIAAAAEASPAEEPEPAGLPEWLEGLPQADKDALLFRVMQGEHAQVAAELGRRVRSDVKRKPRKTAPPPRTAGEIRKRAQELHEARAREEAIRASKERRRREAAAAAARESYLDALAARGMSAWRDLEQLVESKRPTSYDEAVQLLTDLRDLAARERDEPAFAQHLRVIREAHSRKTSFVERLARAGLTGDAP